MYWQRYSLCRDKRSYLMGLYANQMLIELVSRVSEKLKLKKEIKKEEKKKKQEQKQ